MLKHFMQLTVHFIFRYFYSFVLQVDLGNQAVAKFYYQLSITVLSFSWEIYILMLIEYFLYFFHICEFLKKFYLLMYLLLSRIQAVQ